jgi:hypothetical protein
MTSLSEREKPALVVAGIVERPRPAVVEDIASWFTENNAGGLEKRINPRVLIFLNGELVDPKESLKPIGEGLRQVTRIDILENQGYKDICQWIEQTEWGYGIWISPPGDDYKESRFVVYHVEQKGDQKVVFLWGICGYQTGEECVAVANELQESNPDGYKQKIFKNPDELRTKVITFDPPGNTPWTYYLSNFSIAPLEVWQAIDNGDAEELKQEALRQAELVYEEKRAALVGAQTGRETEVVVMSMEMEMQRRMGVRVLPGPCDALFHDGIFSQVFKKATKAEIKNGQRVYECPICGVDVKAGKKCPIPGCNWRAPQ